MKKILGIIVFLLSFSSVHGQQILFKIQNGILKYSIQGEPFKPVVPNVDAISTQIGIINAKAAEVQNAAQTAVTANQNAQAASNTAQAIASSISSSTLIARQAALDATRAKDSANIYRNNLQTASVTATTQAGIATTAAGQATQTLADALPKSFSATQSQAVAGVDNTRYITPLSLLGFGQGTYASKLLPRWFLKLTTAPATATIALVGDSTSELNGAASGIPSYLANNHTFPGDLLAGFSTSNLLDFGLGGQTPSGFITDAGPKGLAALVAAQPNLAVISIGINSARQNLDTKETLKAKLITIVNTVRAGSPNTDIVLRMPNSFRVPATDFYIKQGSYASLAEAAQAQSAILYGAYKELENYWPNVVLLNTQDLIFGRTVRADNTLINEDGIHPGYSPIVDELARQIGYRQPFESARATAAMSVSYSQPWTVYPRALENTDYYRPVWKGRYLAQASGYIDVSGDANSLSTSIIPGDIISIANSLFVKILGVGVSVQNASTARIAGLETIPANSVTGGAVTIYRSIYNHTQAVEPYLKNRVAYPYVRRVKIDAAGNGFFRINSDGIDDDLTVNVPGIKNLKTQFLQLSTNDVLIAEGQSPVTLSSSPSPFNGGLQFVQGGDYSGLQGKVAYIFGNHAYESALRSHLDFGTSAPGTDVLRPGDSVIWKNTTNGEVRWYVNDGGTIKAGAAFSAN